jgi:hypothetical protein
VPSINTAQALELSTRSTGRSALPWILLGVVLTLSAVGAALLLLRPKGEAAADPAPSGSSVAAAPAAPADTPSVALAPPPESSLPGDAGKEKLPAPSKGASGASPPKGGPAPAAPPAGAPPAPAPPAAAAAPAGKPARCFSDPFPGQNGLVGCGRAADAPTFACKQDPFTGKWKKL